VADGVLLSLIDLIVLLCFAVQFSVAGYYFYLLYWLAELPASADALSVLPDDLPRVLIQLPVYNEPTVVERALAAAGALDWPRDRLKIQLLDDSTDLTSDIAVHAIARLRKEGIDVDHVRRSDRSGFKAGALAAGMALDDAPFAAVFDADFVPPPDWLKRAMSAMLAHPKAAFVQTRIEWGNGEHNALTRVQRLMQDAHFAVEQDIRARRGVPFQFNGTGGIWRRAAVEEAGGWSHDTLSEDLDLVLRTYLKGWGGVFLMEPHVVGELPQNLDDFRVQQSRWSKGFVQVARKLLIPIWNSGLSGEAKFTTIVALGQQLVFPVLAAGVIGLIVSGVSHGGLPLVFKFLLWTWFVGVVIVLFGATWGAYRRLKRGSLLQYVATALSVPGIIAYLAAANAGAIIGAGFGKKSEFTRTPKTGGR
jgi:cellulose synthase/poly-beta-1,6-N-acetylglucosamine synthase-like glycosyltransferase